MNNETIEEATKRTFRVRRFKSHEAAERWLNELEGEHEDLRVHSTGSRDDTIGFCVSYIAADAASQKGLFK